MNEHVKKFLNFLLCMFTGTAIFVVILYVSQLMVSYFYPQLIEPQSPLSTLIVFGYMAFVLMHSFILAENFTGYSGKT